MKKVTKEQLAKTLNGNQYKSEITEEQEFIAKENGLVVIFGYSDDNTEFGGAINQEKSSYRGATFVLFKPKDTFEVCNAKAIDEIDEIGWEEISEEARERNQIIDAVWWDKKANCPWS